MNKTQPVILLDSLKKSKRSFTLLIVFLIGLLLISIIFGIMLGPVKISPDSVLKVVLNKLLKKDYFPATWKASTESIVWTIRSPRVAMGIITGAGLSLAGVCMQALTKNSLAGPYILGISSGASTGAVAALTLGIFTSIGIYAVPLSAFLGALVSATLVFAIAKTNGEFTATKLVLTGMAISAVFAACTNILIFGAKDEQVVRSALFWMTGSISGTKWTQLLLPLVTLIISIIILQLFSTSLNGMLLGDHVALTMGIDVEKIRLLLVIITTLLTAIIVSFTGVIGFVGLIVPHGARTIVGSEHSRVIPVSCLIGSILLIWADIGARLIFSPEEIPIGVITSLIGAPFFLWLLKGGKYRFGGS